MRINKTNIYFVLSIVMLALILSLFFYNNNAISASMQASVFSVYNNNINDEPAVLLRNPFDSVDITADSAIVFNPKTNTIFYSKNSLKQMPLASITKLATAALAIEFIDEDEFIPYAGDLFKAKDLIGYMLTVSSNDAAQAIKDYMEKYKKISFDKEIKDLISKIGLKQSYFINPTGLDESDYQAGGYGSAYDVGKLLYYVYSVDPEVIEYTTRPSVQIKGKNGLVINGENTNKIIGQIPGFIGGKTGYTDLAKGNLAVLFEPGGSGPFVIVVLSSDDKTMRFKDVLKLSDIVLENLDILSAF